MRSAGSSTLRTLSGVSLSQNPPPGRIIVSGMRKREMTKIGSPTASYQLKQAQPIGTIGIEKCFNGDGTRLKELQKP